MNINNIFNNILFYPSNLITLKFDTFYEKDLKRLINKKTITNVDIKVFNCNFFATSYISRELKDYIIYTSNYYNFNSDNIKKFLKLELIKQNSLKYDKYYYVYPIFIGITILGLKKYNYMNYIFNFYSGFNILNSLVFFIRYFSEPNDFDIYRKKLKKSIK